ncbi:MAG TPA: nitrate- and nitrite sensing domain-containing protein, partial [Pseudonocardia sp.]|nr:nitrate- and nitrite sensing domain-containing protein [Pseudonocardia sp.]
MTSIESGPSWVERLNPRHWTLVWKLVIVGLVPALLALTLGVLRIADQAGSAADLGRSGRLLEARNEIVAASGALRLERDQATLYAASNGTGDRAAFDTSRQRSDQALNTMRSGLAASNADLEPATMAALQRTQDSLGLISSLRQSVTGTPTRPYDQIVNRYTNVIGTIDVLDRAILRQQRTQATAGLADASSAVTSALEQLSIQHAILAGAIRAGKPLPGDPAVVNAATAQLVNNYRDYQAALTPEQLAKFGNLPDTSATSRMDQLRSAILTAPFQLNPLARDWDAAYDQARQSTDRTAGLISIELSAAAAAAAQRASNLAGINSVILMLGLLVGIAIAVLVARSLIRSLRLLRSSALDVAERRLPQAVESMRAGEAPDAAVEPVPIGTRDEVGQVARAFDAVHGQAVRLAAEQAALQANVSAMFINLSRRSQALVERQLQLIEALESNEQDADQLSNLFQLDHLATRMRRNSENLLVLAGTDFAKRNMAPVPVVDVLRAAVSEVEQYQRVVVQAPPAASIAGRAGSDLVHLLAELLDNATAFSPPESQVVMSTTRSPDGAIVIEISDRGVGMADEELADANMRLVGPSGVDVSASRRMGLFVVGRLAARHGIGVRLSSTAAGPGSGLTASVSVPPSLIPTGVPADAPRPVGVPMPAGVPAQGRPAEARPSWPDANGARPTPLSALVTGADAPGSAPPAARDTSAAGGQSTLFPGKPPVNGNTAHGLPTRRPGSSLRPEGPPPTEAPPGGFFDDGDHGEGDRDERGSRPPGEQARLDQEAAARRDRMSGGQGLTAVPPLDDERSVSDDERSKSGPADRPRLTKDLPESGERPTP